jgi:hypothetical protein
LGACFEMFMRMTATAYLTTKERRGLKVSPRRHASDIRTNTTMDVKVALRLWGAQ